MEKKYDFDQGSKIGRNFGMFIPSKPHKIGDKMPFEGCSMCFSDECNNYVTCKENNFKLVSEYDVEHLNSERRHDIRVAREKQQAINLRRNAPKKQGDE